MRIGMMREQIEIWSSTESVNAFGVPEHKKDLFLTTPASVKHISNTLDGGTTKSFNTNVEFTIRNNRYYSEVDNSMFIKWDGNEYDIVGNNNYYSKSKYLTLVCIKRGK
ncbi:TPA: head-tail adaptor protein [Vibrio parahaemolyticus]